MPNIKSAKKRVSVIARRREENRYIKSTMSTMIKNFKAVVANDANKAGSMLNDIVSYINSAKSKGIIHQNNASRKVARLNIMLNKAKNKEPEIVEVKKAEVVEEKPASTVAKAPAKKVVKKAEPKKAVTAKKVQSKKPVTKE
ncbi:MAG: 30S ribosomal protein S20 [Clostridia bacterium]|nr:30S ribosomal protein S20 [Clostridia bacterium]